jgi:hypothetical protein
MSSMMRLQNEVRLGSSGRTVAEITHCEVMTGLPTLFGHEFTFVFRVEPTNYRENPVTLNNMTVDVGLIENHNSLKIGRFTSRNERPVLLNGKYSDIQQQLYLSCHELIVLSERTHQGDACFEFDVYAKFEDGMSYYDHGRLTIPQTEWLKILNRLELDRYELIVIRTPVAASHLHSPFSDALNKIREAETELTKGHWNGVGVACRSAWNTVMSSVPKGVPRDQRLEHLLHGVNGDARRQKFGLAVLKGFNNIVNEAVHLEGDVLASRAPANLTREDALLCLHWYSTAIGYLASVAADRT